VDAVLALARAEDAAAAGELELLAVESSEVRGAALLRTPSPIGICDAALVGDVLQIVGDEGVALDLSLESFELRRWVDLRAVLGRDCVFEDMQVTDGRHAWVATRARTLAELQASITIQVVDLERRRVVRELPQMIPIQLIPGPRPGDAPLVGGHRDEERGPQLYTTRGRPRRELRRAGEHVEALAVGRGPRDLRGAGRRVRG